jgi:hypothetical protein
MGSLRPRLRWSKEAIADGIVTKVGFFRDWSVWRVGITNDPLKRKREWSATSYVNWWSDWLAESYADACEIERTFIRHGMDGGTGGSTNALLPVFVYVC